MRFGQESRLARYFSDRLEVKNLIPYKISKLTIYHTFDGIIGVKANYFCLHSLNTIKGQAHKANKNIIRQFKLKIKLEQNEYIVHVSGRYEDETIKSIIIKTNQGKEYNVGGLERVNFQYEAEQFYHLGVLSGGINQFLNFLDIIYIPIDEHIYQHQWKWDMYYQFKTYYQVNYHIQFYKNNKSKVSKITSQSIIQNNYIIIVFRQFQSVFKTNWNERLIVRVYEPNVMSQNYDNYQILKQIDNLIKFSRHMEFSVSIWRIHNCQVDSDQISILNQQKPFYDIRRKLREFILLRQTLANRFPGLFIPSLPIQGIFNDFKTETLEYNRIQCEKFLTNIINIPFLFQSVEVQMFLKGVIQQNQDDFQIPVLKELEELVDQSPSYEEVKQRYSFIFESATNLPPVTEEQKNKFNEFMNFVYKNQTLMEKLVRTTKSIQKCHSKSAQDLYIFSKYMYSNHKRFILTDEQYNDQVQLLKQDNFDTVILTSRIEEQELLQPFSLLYDQEAMEIDKQCFDQLMDFMKMEERDLQALRISMNYIKTLESDKINFEKKQIDKSFFFVTPSDAQIKQYKKEIEYINQILHILYSVYTYYLIDEIYLEKKEIYCRVMKICAQLQLEELEIKHQYWKKTEEELSRM